MSEQAVLRVGLCQAQLSWSDRASNFARLEAMLEDGRPQADIIVLPETFSTGFLGDSGVEAEDMDGSTVAWLRNMAERYGCVMSGSAVIEIGGKRLNRLLWVEPDGLVRHYDKKHLFAHGGEHERYTAGSERVVIQYRGWRIFPQVCYDIRFPVWCRNRGDYDLMLVVANWPCARADAWSSLLKARAIENQCYVIAVNRVGEDGRGLHYPGLSVVHDPLGAERLQLADRMSYAETEISLDNLYSVRGELPFLADADPFKLL